MLVGNTVRLHAEFKNLEGALYDPSNVKIKVYDVNMKILLEKTAKKEGVGKYYYDYTLTAADYIYEFSGIIPATTFPVLARASLSASQKL
jgi:hypothetical protein